MATFDELSDAGTPTAHGGFGDLLAANDRFASRFEYAHFDGIAKAGVLMVTCMDSRIDPLGIIGLAPGDAKILRNPGGRVTEQVLLAIVVGVALLNVQRVLVVQHTRCAMASHTEDELRRRVGEANGADADWMTFGVIADQHRSLAEEVRKVIAHPLVPSDVLVGGFLYEVETGRLRQVV